MIRTNRRMFGRVLLATTMLAPTMAAAQTLPTGGVVSAGTATIGSPSAGSLGISQISNRAVIDWQSFSIGTGQRVDIVQPSATATLLNRVSGTTSSTIAGQINANGRVFLVNPNGILITGTGTINTSGFVASTLAISDTDFMAGRYGFAGTGGTISNQGTISIVHGGYAALMAGKVENAGLILAPLGAVTLAAGTMATIDLEGDGFLQIAMPATRGGIDMSGSITADGGAVVLRAASALDAARHAVNLSGTIEARSVSGSNGNVSLDGGTGEDVAVAGGIDVSAGPGASQGGRIDIAGEAIALTGASLMATGIGGGGLVRVGGAFQGGRPNTSDIAQSERFAGRFGALPPIANALSTAIDAGSMIDISATGSGGVGGTATIWSVNATDMAGHILAAGARAGGAVEISSGHHLQFTALSRLTIGAGGSLLLDSRALLIDPEDSQSDYQGVTHLQDVDLVAQLSAGVTVDLKASNNVGWVQNRAFVTRPSLSVAGGDLNISAGGSVSLDGIFVTGDGAWSVIANNIAAHGVVDAERGPGGARIDVAGASFITSGTGSNGKLSFFIDDGAGNTNSNVDGIALGAIVGDSLTAAIKPGTTGSHAILLNNDIGVYRDISLTGDLADFGANVTLSGQKILWTNEKTDGRLTGYGTLTFVENGVVTRIGHPGEIDAVRLELGPVGGLRRAYGDADPTAADIGAQVHVADYSAIRTVPDRIYGHGDADTPPGELPGMQPPPESLDTILNPGSISVAGPGVGAAVGQYALTISATATALTPRSYVAYFLDLTAQTVPLAIDRRPVTLTASNLTYTYGSPAAAVKLANVVNGDVISPLVSLDGKAGVTMTAIGDGFGIAPMTSVGSKAYVLTGIIGANADNYAFSCSSNFSGTLSITPKPLTFAVQNGGQIYGTLGSLPAAALAGILAADEVLPLVALSASDVPALFSARLGVGTYAAAVTSLTGAAAGNYRIAPSGNIDGAFSVTARKLTYSVSDASSVYGTLANLGQRTLAGVLSGDIVTPGALSVARSDAPGIALSLIPTTPVGSFLETITGISGADAHNYLLADSGNHPGILTIVPKTLTYSGVKISQTYGDPARPAPALLGIVGTDQVEALARISAGPEERGGSGAIPVGTYSVDLASLYGAGASNYILSTTGNLPNIVTVNPKAVAFQIGATDSIYGEPLGRLATLSGVVAGDSISTRFVDAVGGGSIDERTSVGTYGLVVGGFTGPGAANYIVASAGNVAGTLRIAPRALTWSLPTDATLVYGELFDTFRPIFAGLVNGDVIGAPVHAVDSMGTVLVRPSVGRYALAISDLTGPAASNYMIAGAGNLQGEVTVSPRPIVPTGVYVDTSQYGEVPQGPFATFAQGIPGWGTGLLYEDEFLVHGIFHGSVDLASAVPGVYDQYLIGLDNKNYKLDQNSYGPYPYTITKRLLFPILSSHKAVYGDSENYVISIGKTTEFTGQSGSIGVLPGDDVGVYVSAGNVFDTTSLNVGSYLTRVTALVGADAYKYAIGSDFVGDINITPKVISYFINSDGPYGYGSLPFSFKPTVDLIGLLDRDRIGANPVIAEAISSATAMDRSAGGYLKVGSYTWTASLPGYFQNYILANQPGFGMTVTPKSLLVQAKVVGGAAFSSVEYGNTSQLFPQASITGLVDGDKLALSAAFSIDGQLVQQIPSRQSALSYVTVVAIPPADPGSVSDYQVTYQSGGVGITRKAVDIHIRPISTIYGSYPTFSADVTGMLSGDDVVADYLSLEPTADLYNRKVVGTYSIISQNGSFSLNGIDSANYQLKNTIDALWNVTPKGVVVTTTPTRDTYVYGDPIDAREFSIKGLLPYADVTGGAKIESGNQFFDMTKSRLNVGTYILRPDLIGYDTQNYVAVSETDYKKFSSSSPDVALKNRFLDLDDLKFGVFTIVPRQLTLTLRGETTGSEIEYGATRSSIDPTVGNFVDGDTVSTTYDYYESHTPFFPGYGFRDDVHFLLGPQQVTPVFKGGLSANYLSPGQTNFSIVPTTLTYSVSSGGVLGGTTFGKPGIVTFGGSFIPGDDVRPVVRILESDGGGSYGLDPSIRPGEYRLAVIDLAGKDADHYRLSSQNGPGSDGMPYNELGTFYVLGNSQYGLGAVRTSSVQPRFIVSTSSATASSTTASPGETSSSPLGAITQGGAASTEGAASQRLGGAIIYEQGSANAGAHTGAGGAGASAAASGQVGARVDANGVTITISADVSAGAEISVGLTGLSGSATANTSLSTKVEGGGDLGKGTTGTASGRIAIEGGAEASGSAGLIDKKLGVAEDASLGAGIRLSGAGGIHGATGSVDVGATVVSPGSLGLEGGVSAGVSDGQFQFSANIVGEFAIGGVGVNLGFAVDLGSAQSAGIAFVAGLSKFFGGPSGDDSKPVPETAAQIQARLANDAVGKYEYLLAHPVDDPRAKNMMDKVTALNMQYQDFLAMEKSASDRLSAPKATSRDVEYEMQKLERLQTNLIRNAAQLGMKLVVSGGVVKLANLH